MAFLSGGVVYDSIDPMLQQTHTLGASNSRAGKINCYAFCPRLKDIKYNAKCSCCCCCPSSRYILK